jgi:SAM-dependent methyltransferase
VVPHIAAVTRAIHGPAGTSVRSSYPNSRCCAAGRGARTSLPRILELTTIRYVDDEDRARLNRAWWDERVAVHMAGEFYDVAGFLAGRSTLRPFEVAEMGDVTGSSMVHLQCHFGLDTLSWARQGALVTGVDFSPNAIASARDLARRAGIPAHFVEAGVYEAVTALDRRAFDVVYTSIGTIIWLPDLARWASTVAALLAPGGRFYMAEFHPFSVVLGDEDLTVTDSYFDQGPFLHDESGSYADPDAQTVHRQSVTWHHGLGAVISALAGAGLRIEFLHEHPYALRARWPFLERSADRTYHMPAGKPQVPLLYSLKATQPR